MKQKNGFFEKINKIYKTLAKLTERKKTWNNIIRGEKRNIIRDNSEIQKIIW
jgi:hypothetical protein